MYYTVDIDKERNEGERPVEVEFVVRPDEESGERRFTLCSGGEWLQGLDGDVTMPAQEDPPVNTLFLALRQGDDTDEEFFAELAEAAGPIDAGEAAARAGEGKPRMELRVKNRDGRETTVPVRSVQRGASTLSFYRQSGHQTL